MLLAWTMTLLARDPEYEVCPAKFIYKARLGHWLKERSMTLKTTRDDRPAEIYISISITGTINPTRYLSPVRNRKLKELIVLVPVKIRLSFASGADDDIEAFGK